ncbi:helix-turn-helix domain-containing protein [Maridesulfovibrio salexigens]|uniref:Transcriptional regulator, XRE family n=1 Tax=Maridesulfovibrio salexigens (strain ATCC 14822 / DSM 2638 / NCIMB 8403 / VKM B-1763) TaxID=526222 RepID=C6BW15_MARSD|nr:helix-turn-helix transcriptional regulator [Maridesulfovibrio salexigens]ACS80218.1 transcriptional regulator, XRE family [Maridesulfovibrio salexigens DSM 2638]
MNELSPKEIGQRLKAFRLGSKYSTEEIAAKIGISRAALYRYEKGDPPKLETLESIADLLGVSLTSLMGVGVEYISSAISFFERMRQNEAESEQLAVMFGLVSYLLTTDEFDEYLEISIKEGLPKELQDDPEIMGRVSEILSVLRERKKGYYQRRPSMVNLASATNLEQFLRSGFVGTFDLPEEELQKRREVARREVKNVISLLEEQPIGVQIGLLVDSVPSTHFQIFRQSERSTLCLSPYKLCHFPNVRLGVGMLTSAPEALELHQKMISELWGPALKGRRAADYLRKMIEDCK